MNISPPIVSANRLKKRAKKAATIVAETEARTLKRIEGLFLLGWSTEAIADELRLDRDEVIRRIQTSTPKKTEAL